MEQETLLYMEIAAEIERKIEEGHYKEGDKLPSERELTVEYQGSRNVIRQAITILREKGLLTVKPGKGAYVTRLKDTIVSDSLMRIVQKYDSSFEDILEVREELEILIIRKAVKKATSENVQELKRLYHSMEEKKQILSEFMEEDLNFHITIAIATQNPIFPILIRSFFDMTERLSFTVSKFTKDYIDVNDTVLDHHMRLIEAIEKRDEELAVAIIKEHMKVFWEEIQFLRSRNLI